MQYEGGTAWTKHSRLRFAPSLFRLKSAVLKPSSGLSAHSVRHRMTPRHPVGDAHLPVSHRLILFLIFYVQLVLPFTSTRSSSLLLAGVRLSIANPSFRPSPSTSTVTNASSVPLRTPSPSCRRRVINEPAYTLSLACGGFQRSVCATENRSPLVGVLAGHAGIHGSRSEEHTSELQSPDHLVCRLLLEKKKKHYNTRSLTP